VLETDFPPRRERLKELGAIEASIEKIHQFGVVDLHFDMGSHLFEQREHAHVLERDFAADYERGGVGVIGAAVWLQDEFLPELALRNGLDQIARIYKEVEADPRFVICRTYAEIMAARAAHQFAFVITFEGIEPIGTDLDLLRVFFELGLRVVGLTHVRRNYAGGGGAFGRGVISPKDGLTRFGTQVLHECERLGILVDLAHINPQGFEDVMAIATKPVMISHTNTRRFHDIERNTTDEQARAIGQSGGVIGVNAMNMGFDKPDFTLDRFVDHVEHFVKVAGIDAVGIGFDFLGPSYRYWSEEQKARFTRTFVESKFIPGLGNHGDSRNVTRALLERGFAEADVAKIVYGNFMRLFEGLLPKAP
jgi:membrane dipeptidase